MDAATPPGLPLSPAPASLGLLRLDTRFPRLPGDAGRADAWPVPVRVEVIEGAFPASVVQGPAALRRREVLPAFVAGARRLEAAGVRAITTSCGFLVLLQAELQAAVAVPLVTSSLLQLPALLQAEPQVGVLTISAARLGDPHLLSAGVPPDRLADVVVEGVDPQGEFATAILGNLGSMDPGPAGREVIEAALRLRQRAPGLRTVVLECTNMPPHAGAVAAATGLRVLSLVDSPVLRAALGGTPGGAPVAARNG